MNLQSDMFAIGFWELKCVRNDTLVIQDDAGADNSLIDLVQFFIKGDSIHFLLMELRVRQFGRQVAIIGEQEHTGGVSVQTTYRIDTLCASITNDINDGMTLLRVVSRGNGILRLIEQDIDLALALNRLVVETNIIGWQHFDAEVIDSNTIDGDDTGLDEIVCFTTGADTCVSEELIETNRLGRILVLLAISLLFTIGIKSVITFRFASERTVGALGAFTERTLYTFAEGTLGSSDMLSMLACKSGASRNGLAFSLETRTRSALRFIVGIVVHTNCCLLIVVC